MIHRVVRLELGLYEFTIVFISKQGLIRGELLFTNPLEEIASRLKDHLCQTVRDSVSNTQYATHLVFKCGLRGRTSNFLNARRRRYR